MKKSDKDRIRANYYNYNRNGEGYTLNVAYGRTSYRKRNIWASILWIVKDARVTSHSCHFFSCAGWNKKNGNFEVYTPNYHYSVTKEELACILQEG